MKMVSVSLNIFLVVLVPCVLVQGFPDFMQDISAAIEQDDSKGEYKAEENLGNSGVTEGDIKLDESTRAIMDNLKSNARDAITNTVKHWPGGRVPYVFGRVSSRVRSAFRAAISDYNRYTCVRLVPRKTERNYIYVVSEGGCWSPIGRSGRRQKLSLGPGCEHKGTAIHEIMHALGFFHEQSRLDRDRYITIYWNNINKDKRNNFEKYRHGEADTLGAPYDYGSVMHYPQTAFSNNGQKTIVPKRSGVRLGQRDGFSKIDLQQINKLYKCRGSVRPTKPRPKPPTRPHVVSCYDRKRSCSSWAKSRYCTSKTFGAYMRINCKKSCGFCGRVCKDKRRGCPRWLQYCKRRVGNKFYNFMMTNCKRSCRKC